MDIQQWINGILKDRKIPVLKGSEQETKNIQDAVQVFNFCSPFFEQKE